MYESFVDFRSESEHAHEPVGVNPRLGGDCDKRYCRAPMCGIWGRSSHHLLDDPRSTYSCVEYAQYIYDLRYAGVAETRGTLPRVVRPAPVNHPYKNVLRAQPVSTSHACPLVPPQHILDGNLRTVGISQQ